MPLVLRRKHAPEWMKAHRFTRILKDGWRRAKFTAVQMKLRVKLKVCNTDRTRVSTAQAAAV